MDVFPPLMPSLHRLRAFVGRGKYTLITKYLLADMRCLVSAVCNNSFDFWKSLRYLVIYPVKGHTVVDISRSYHYFQYEYEKN